MRAGEPSGVVPATASQTLPLGRVSFADDVPQLTKADSHSVRRHSGSEHVPDCCWRGDERTDAVGSLPTLRRPTHAISANGCTGRLGDTSGELAIRQALLGDLPCAYGGRGYLGRRVSGLDTTLLAHDDLLRTFVVVGGDCRVGRQCGAIVVPRQRPVFGPRVEVSRLIDR